MLSLPRDSLAAELADRDSTATFMMLEVFAAAKLPLPAAYDNGEAEDLKAKVATVKAIEYVLTSLNRLT